ncbi:MAG: hypothetical protein PHV49_02925 [Alistipes sp.]|nr:hypothetical protein [Alistipes sp.]
MMHVSLFRSPILLLTLLGVGCSTTRHIPSGDALYTGVRHIRIAADSANPPLALAVKSAVKAPLSVAPNNSLFKPYLRTPLPLGLWIYNGFYTTHTKGFRAWVFRKFSKPPVLLSSVQPQLRIHYVRELLAEYGYFEAQTGYTLLPRHNPHKVKLNYWIRAGMPWHYHSVTYPTLSPAMDSVTAALWPLSPLKAGNLYNADSLVAERNRVALRLRNAGYYYFQPDFLTYLADSSQADRRVALRMILRPGVPEPALQPYRIAQVTVQLHTPSSHAHPDTLSWQNGALLYQPPLRLRLRRLERLSTLRPGALLSVDSLNITLLNLNRLGIFSSVTASLPPLDSVDVAGALPIVIHATLNRPIQSDLETDFTAKSNRFLGPGLSWKVSHNNLFGGGERLTVGLKASYEWETRSNKSSHSAALNSYELGIDASLLSGQLWAPARWRNRLPDASSEVRLGVDLLNRPRFFRLAAFDIGLTYRFSTSSRSTHALSLCQVSYNHMIHTTVAFDSTMTANPAIALSFRDQLIPTWSYTDTPRRTSAVGGTAAFHLFGQFAICTLCFMG